MSHEFSITSHTTFFDGYLDAVGRHYSDERRLCAISVNLMPAEFLVHLSIASDEPIENMVRDFERDIAKFLNTDSTNRLVFYLIEYFDWYRQFSDTCTCEKVQVRGSDFPDDYIAYRLFIDGAHEILFLGCWKGKNGSPNNRL